MAITFTYTEATNKVVNTEGTSGTPSTNVDFVHFDRTVATAACTIASGAELKAATAVADPTDLTLTYPMRPVENKALRLAITTAANGGAAVSGDETVDIYGTTAIWQKLTGASASGQKVVPIADFTHNHQVGDTVILIDISAPGTYETDVIASIQEGISITLTNNNTNAYAIGDIIGIYQTEQIDISAAFDTYWSTVPYGQIAKLTFTGFDGTNTAKVDQPIWGVIWDYGNEQYKIDAHFDIGNSSTSTYFRSVSESVYFIDTMNVGLTTQATLQIGALNGDWPTTPSYWSMDPARGTIHDWAGTVLWYGSTIVKRGGWAGLQLTGAFTIRRGMYIGDTQDNFSLGKLTGGGTADVKEFYIEGTARLYFAPSSTTNADRIHSHGTTTAGIAAWWADATTTGILITGAGGVDWEASTNGDLTMIDAVASPSSVKITDAANWIKEQYTCNSHVADKDGGAIADTATVACTRANVVTESAKFYKCISAHTSGTFATDLAAGKWEEITDSTILDAAPAWLTSTAYISAEAEFSVNPTSGAIAEQTLTYKVWTGTSELETKYIHTFTLSESGYETLVVQDIEVDGAIGSGEPWHLELQDMNPRKHGRREMG